MHISRTTDAHPGPASVRSLPTGWRLSANLKAALARGGFCERHSWHSTSSAVPQRSSSGRWRFSQLHGGAAAERLLTAYVWAVLATCLTAAVVCLSDWSRLCWLIPVAVLSYLLALVGYVAVRRGWPKWVGAHGLGGSYIALWTALLVVTAGDISTAAEIIAWILPAAIGVPLIVRTHMGTRAERRMPRVL
jgi:hypothetical protein